MFSYNIYLGISLLSDNKSKIISLGQNTVSKTVEIGTTTVFLGIGKSFDHFEKKWDSEYKKKLSNVDVEIKKITKDSFNTNKIYVDLIFNNKNPKDKKVNLNKISGNNYILIGDNNNLYYPLTINNNQYDHYLPHGKIVLQFEGVVPEDLKVKKIRLLDRIQEVNYE